MQEKKITRFALVLLKCSLILLAVIVAAHLILGVLLYSLAFIIAGLTGSPINVPDVLKEYISRPNWKAEEFFDDPKVIALCNAIDNRDVETINKLVAEGVDVNTKGVDGMTLLLWSFPAGEKVFEQMLKHGADPNTVYYQDYYYTVGGRKLHYGDRLIFLAIASTSGPPDYNKREKEKHKNYLKLLIDNGADINVHRTAADYLRTPLHYAASLNNRSAVRQLLEANVDVNAVDSSNYTPAMRLHNIDTTFLLLKAGTDYRIVGRHGKTIVHLIADMKVMSEEAKVYNKIVKWFSERGISIDRAREQIQLMRNPSSLPPDEANRVRKQRSKMVLEGTQAAPPIPQKLTKEEFDEYEFGPRLPKN